MGEFLLLPAPCNGQCIIVKNHVPHHDLSLAGNLGPPQKRLNAQQQLLLINGLGHIIVRPHQKALVLILRKLSCRDHQNGQVFVCAPNLFGKFITGHLRHHDIQNHQIYMLPIQYLQRLLPVGRSDHIVILRLQHCPEQESGIFIVIHNQNAEHPLHPIIILAVPWSSSAPESAHRTGAAPWTEDPLSSESPTPARCS